MKAILIKPIDGLEVGDTINVFEFHSRFVPATKDREHAKELVVCYDHDMETDTHYEVLIPMDIHDFYEADTFAEYFFVLQELPETITRQIQEKLQFLCIDAYEAGLTARDKNEERVITGAVVNERIGLVLSAVKDLLAGVSSDIGDTNGS